jgi:plasmid stabilization system protein ParE
MARHLNILPQANAHMDDIYAFIASDNRNRAISYIAELRVFLVNAAEGPFDLSTSRPGWPAPFRALVFGRKPHARTIVVYVTDDVLHVHGVFAGQDIPTQLTLSNPTPS